MFVIDLETEQSNQKTLRAMEKKTKTICNRLLKAKKKRESSLFSVSHVFMSLFFRVINNRIVY